MTDKALFDKSRWDNPTSADWFFAAFYWFSESSRMAAIDPEYSRMCIRKCGFCLARGIGMEE